MRFSGMEQIVTRHSIKTKIGLIGKSQQAQRINPHIGPPWSIDISIVILLKFFFGTYRFSRGWDFLACCVEVSWRDESAKGTANSLPISPAVNSTIWSCLPIRFKREIVALWLRIRKRTVRFAFNKVFLNPFNDKYLLRVIAIVEYLMCIFM